MRKSVSFALIAAVAVLLGATAILMFKYRNTNAAYANLQAEEQATRERFAGAINEIAVIQDSLNAIALGDSAARLLPTQLQSELSLSESRGDAALERIAVIKAGIERTKDRIEQLDASLKHSGVRIAGLTKMVDNLKKSVVEKEAYVAELTGRVDSLQTTVTGLVAEVEQDNQTIETQRKELGTVYVVVGTRKDLTASGVVEAKGGLLGLGKTLTPSGNVDENAFTTLDTDFETVIQIPAAKAQVLSAQPPSSYELQLVGDQMQLRILDPEKFRTVKHVVIMTT